MHLDQPETRYVSVDDVQVAYQVVGDGDIDRDIDLVYHHGFCHLDLQWDVVAESDFNRRLASFSRLILFDRRGTGASERLSAGSSPSLDQWSADLLAVLDEVGSSSPAIFAESDAGAMAIRFAVTYPDRVSALVLANTRARYAWSPDYPFGMSPEQIERTADFLESVWGVAEKQQLLLPGVGHNPADLAALGRVSRAAATPGAAKTHFLRMFRELDVRDDLPRVLAPTLVIDANERISRDAAYLAEHIPGATLVRAPSRATLLFGDAFDDAVSEAAAFLTGRHLRREATRRLVTVMFTDIVSSTRHVTTLGDQRWRGILDSHDGAVRDALARFEGSEIKTTGDGFLAAFEFPSAAILCAAQILTALGTLGLQGRVGIHSGECEVREGDLAGMAVHVASRVAAVASDDEIIVSRTVADLLLGSGIELAEHGEHDLKGVPGPWTLYRYVRKDAPAHG